MSKKRLTRTPSPPTELSKRAATEWRRLAPRCMELGTLTGVDLRAFEMLCVTLAAEFEAREVLQKEGLTVLTGAGGSKPHPCVRQAENARSQATRLLAEFGLTPRGRNTVKVKYGWNDPDDDEDDDE